MARQNVGNPKFYIDMLSYWLAKGNILGIGTSVNNLFGQSDYRPKLVGLNPSDFINEVLTFGRDFTITLHQPLYPLVEPGDKFFVGFLGHNFEDANIMLEKLLFVKSNGGIGLDQSTGSFDNICNFPESSDTPFSYNGWSLGEFTGGDGDKIKDIIFRFIPEDSEDYPWEYSIKLGSLSFGYVYQMPHSPDLKLTMTREYEGVKERTTIGGSTLTQIDYTTQPQWAGLPAWEVSTSQHGGYLEQRKAERGRRVWDLKFSYVGSDDLFAVNEHLTQENPTDSSTNEDAGYDTITDESSTDFNIATGNFKSFFERDSSFVSQIMFRTMGGALPFIFQPDGNNNSPDQFAIAKIDQGSFQFKQVVNNVYNISLRIKEVW